MRRPATNGRWALEPEFVEAHTNLGNALKARGKLEEAAASYERALALKPDYAEAHFNLGNVFRDQGRLDAALVNYERSLALKPDFADAHWNRSLAQLLLGDFAAGSRICLKLTDSSADRSPTVSTSPMRRRRRLPLT